MLNFFLGTSLFVCLSEGMTIEGGGGENRLKTARDGVGYFRRAPLLRNHLYKRPGGYINSVWTYPDL